MSLTMVAIWPVWRAYTILLICGNTVLMLVSGQPRSPVEEFITLITAAHYDHRVPPYKAVGEPIHVKMGVYVNSLGDINERNQDYTVNMYFRQRWSDYRLNYTNNITGVDSITLPVALIKRMWVPDPFFENGKDEKFHSITVPNNAFRVYPDGSIFYSQRLTIKVHCQTELSNFPLDNQTCYIKIMSYRYSTKEMILSWMDPWSRAVVRHPTLDLPRFHIQNITTGDCTHGYSTGSYSCVFAAFHLNRRFGYYLIQIYIPSMLIVLLSWVSFWLDALAVPARISLGVLTVLTMSTQMASAASSALPEVSYVKAMDVWLTTCMLFLFAALMEFAIANMLARREISAADKYKPGDDVPKLAVFVKSIIDARREPDRSNEAETVINNVKEKRPKKDNNIRPRAHHVDYVSKICFPVAFAVFNAAYWYVYTRSR